MKQLKIHPFNLNGVTNLIVSKLPWNKIIRKTGFNIVITNSVEVAS